MLDLSVRQVKRLRSHAPPIRHRGHLMVVDQVGGGYPECWAFSGGCCISFPHFERSTEVDLIEIRGRAGHVFRSKRRDIPDRKWAGHPQDAGRHGAAPAIRLPKKSNAWRAPHSLATTVSPGSARSKRSSPRKVGIATSAPQSSQRTDNPAWLRSTTSFWPHGQGSRYSVLIVDNSAVPRVGRACSNVGVLKFSEGQTTRARPSPRRPPRQASRRRRSPGLIR